MAETHQFCSFSLDSGLFGIEVEQVQEIIRYQDMTRVPLAPKDIAGLINLRGQIVPAIDLRCCLGMTDRRDGHLPTNVVIRTDDGAVSLLVDDIGDVLDVTNDTFESAPDNLDVATKEIIRGVYKLERGLLMVLSTETVIALSTARIGEELDGTRKRHRHQAAEPASLFVRLGGLDPLRVVVQKFYARLFADDELRGFFAEANADHLRLKMLQFLAQAFGGPARPTARTLREVHRRLPITGRHFDRALDHLIGVLREMATPDSVIDDVKRIVAPLAEQIVTR